MFSGFGKVSVDINELYSLQKMGAIVFLAFLINIISISLHLPFSRFFIIFWISFPKPAFLSLHRYVLALRVRPSQQSSCARAEQGYTGLAKACIERAARARNRDILV